jgi:hypothetical protein
MYRWFWKCERLFFAGKLLFMVQFNEYFEGAKIFLTPKLSRAYEISLEMANKGK